jgi:hypothetical protein
MLHAALNRAIVVGLIVGAVGCAQGDTLEDDGAGGSSSSDPSTGGGNPDGGNTGNTNSNGSSSDGAGGSGPTTRGCGNMCDEDGDGVFDPMDECSMTPAGEAVNGVGCSDSQVDPKLQEMWPPYGLTWTPMGDPGKTGGLTWKYTGIDHGELFHIDWILCDDPTTPCGVSLDGPVDMSEGWTFSAADSNLAGGILVMTNTTHISLADGSSPPLAGRMTVIAKDANDQPIPFADVATLGVTPRDGKYGIEVPGDAFTINVLIDVKDASSAYKPYIEYYDAAPTPDPGPGTAMSLAGSFYDE